MGILCFVLFGLIFIAFYYGYAGYKQVDYVLEIKDFSVPYYKIGISFEEFVREDDDLIQQEFCIGLFFIHIVVVFYK
jgi:hypothetical protein